MSALRSRASGGIKTEVKYLKLIELALMSLNSGKKDDPVLNMTPKQVTHVRICQRLLLLIAQQPQRTSM